MSLILTRRLTLLGASAAVLTACAKKGGGGEASAANLPSDMSLGNPNAKVTVVEYASVACPVCGGWFRETWPAFKAKFVDTGKIKYVLREMLVGGQDEVATAASGFLLARCAGKDRYFQIVDAIFNSQNTTQGAPGLFTDPRGTLLDIAKSAGFTEAQFDACVRDESAIDALQKRVESNSKIDNVNSTPTFVVNGTPLAVGPRSLDELTAAIDKAQKG
jgi:protein-disulfide isomerase